MTVKTDLKTKAVDLLKAGKVDVLIGYEAGSLPLSATPLILHADSPRHSLQRSPGKSAPVSGGEYRREAAKLIFDARCEMNLVNLLHKFKDKKVAIVVKGCDSRSLVGLIQEKQFARENLVILGAPCRGVIDHHRLFKLLGCDSPASAVMESDQIRAVCHGIEKCLALNDVLYPACRECPVHNPLITDYLIADTVKQEKVPDISPEFEAVRRMSRDERWQKFQHEMQKCILCYACRNLCPACYCKECFTDISRPKLVGRTDDPADAMFFHLLRMVHMGGRCTGCGACVRGCPMGVDLRPYNDNLRQIMKKQYGFEAGLDPKSDPPLTCFKPDDPDDFMM